MHGPQPIPRGESTTKSFDDDLIARTLSNAADIRRTLKFSRGDLFLDADGRRSDPEQAAQASTDGCIRLASMALCPDDSLDARDLRWHAATRFQRRIGCGIETYDNNPNTTRNGCCRPGENRRRGQEPSRPLHLLTGHYLPVRGFHQGLPHRGQGSSTLHW